MNILELNDAEVDLKAETPNAIHYNVKSTLMFSVCPACGGMKVKKIGLTTPMLVNDTPRSYRPVGLWVRQQRILCLDADCRTSTTLRPEWMHSHFRMTLRLVSAVQKACLESTFKHVSRTMGIDEKTVRDIFSEYAAELDVARGEVFPPRILGIDETWLTKPRNKPGEAKKPRSPALVLTNVEEGTLLEMYERRDYALLEDVLRGYKKQNAIRTITIDMHRPYKTTIRRVFPERDKDGKYVVQIVVDKFHFIRLADQSVEALRRQVQNAAGSKKDFSEVKKLRHFLKTRTGKLTVFGWGRMREVSLTYPVLQEAWQKREDLYRIYDVKTRLEAEKAYDNWEKSLSPTLRTVFKSVTTAAKGWREEIFSFFDAPFTNAATEAINGLIKVINRSGRGYSFDVLRVKALYAPKFQRSTTIRYLYCNPEGLDLPDEITYSIGVELTPLVDWLADTLKPTHGSLS